MPDTTPPTGTTNTQGLAPWAAPYITDYLSRAQTLANEPTQVYHGQLTAGPSQLQNQAFAGIGGLTVPTGIGQGAYDAGQYGRMAATTQYQPQTMNFLGQSFAPQQQPQYTPQPIRQPPIDFPQYPQDDPSNGGEPGGITGLPYRRGGANPMGGSYDGSGINPGGKYNQPTGGMMPPRLGGQFDPSGGFEPGGFTGGKVGMGGGGPNPMGGDMSSILQQMQNFKGNANGLSSDPSMGERAVLNGGNMSSNQSMGNGSVQSVGPNGEMTGGMPMFGGQTGGPMESFAPMSPQQYQEPELGPPKDMQNFGGMGRPAPGAPNYNDTPNYTPPGGGGPNPMTGGPMPPAQPPQPAQSIAQQYMNPYLQASLDPQLAAAKRAADIQAQTNNAAMTKAGAFGGGRQAILTSEGQRNLGDTMSNITGQGYNTAYDKAMQQFNADQDRQMKEAQFGTTSRLQGLQTGIQGAQTQGQLADTQNKANISNLNTQMNAGDVQRGITSEGIKADYDEWMRQKDDPYKKAQFQKDMLAGLPVGSMTNSAAGLSGIAGLISAMGGVGALNTALGDPNSPLGKLLGQLGLGTGTTTGTGNTNGAT